MPEYTRMSQQDRNTLLGTVVQETEEAERAYVEWREKIKQHIKTLRDVVKALDDGQVKDHPQLDDGEEKAVSNAVAKMADGPTILDHYKQFAATKSAAKTSRARLDNLIPKKPD
jgi:hypothetical protein